MNNSLLAKFVCFRFLFSSFFQIENVKKRLFHFVSTLVCVCIALFVGVCVEACVTNLKGQ